jgi:hypothetical protein
VTPSKSCSYGILVVTMEVVINTALGNNGRTSNY